MAQTPTGMAIPTSGVRSTVVIVPKEITLPEPRIAVPLEAAEMDHGEYEPTTPGEEDVDADGLLPDSEPHLSVGHPAEVEVQGVQSSTTQGIRRRIRGKTTPKRRLYGKTKQAPVLRILRTGGEWSAMEEYDKEFLEDGTVGWLEGMDDVYITEDEEAFEEINVDEEQEDSEYDSEAEYDFEHEEHFVKGKGIINEEEKTLSEEERPVEEKGSVEE